MSHPAGRAEKDIPLLINSDDDRAGGWGLGFDCPRLGECHANSRLQERSRDHEDDKQYEHDVNEGRHIDFGESCEAPIIMMKIG